MSQSSSILENLDDESLIYICELIKSCICVDNEVIMFLIDELEKCSSNNTAYDSSIQSQIARIHLENLSLIEHGTSIRGSWLTDEGKNILYQINYIREMYESK